MAAEEKEQEKKSEPQPKRSFLKWIIVGALLVVLGIGGFLGWKNFRPGKDAPQELQSPQSPAGTKKERSKVIYPLEAFIVNLMGKAGMEKRYLKVTLSMGVETEVEKGVLEKNKIQLRDAILLLLSEQTVDEINTVERKLILKQILLSRCNQVLGDPIIKNLYFTEFVVQ